MFFSLQQKIFCLNAVIWQNAITPHLSRLDQDFRHYWIDTGLHLCFWYVGTSSNTNGHGLRNVCLVSFFSQMQSSNLFAIQIWYPKRWLRFFSPLHKGIQPKEWQGFLLWIVSATEWCDVIHILYRTAGIFYVFMMAKDWWIECKWHRNGSFLQVCKQSITLVLHTDIDPCNGNVSRKPILYTFSAYLSQIQTDFIIFTWLFNEREILRQLSS